MKKKHVSKLISAALSLSMVCGLSTAALAAGPFVDSAGDYGPAIEILQDNGLVNGTGDNQFNPDRAMTLAELVTILGRMAGAQVDQSAVPANIQADGWSGGYVAWAMDQGLVRVSQYGQYDALTAPQMNEILVAFSALTGVRTFSVSAAGTQVTRGEAALALAPLSQAVAAHDDGSAISLAPVELSVGTLIGYQMDGVYNFKGVPYATAERFQAPVPITEYPSNGYGPDGVRMALAYGEVSPQSRTLNGTGAVNIVEFMTPSNGVADMVANETCQYLNIWTDDLTANKPVIVFFHGGGLESGASSELSIYTGEYFAAVEDAVIVTVNHRLNYLGFLDMSAYGEEYESSGTVGMLDCVAALQWVHDNITKFGGDPSNVTIAGQSGGGGKVAALACMPAAENLFDKVVYMSGVNTFINQDGENGSLAQTQKLADYLGLSGQAFVDRVTTMSYEELYAACNAAGVRYSATVGNSALPAALFDGEGNLNPLAAKRTWMIGCTVGEGATNGIPLTLGAGDDYYLPGITDEDAMARLTESYGDNAQAIADAFRAAYPGHPLAEAPFVAIVGSNFLGRLHDVEAENGLIAQFNAAGKEVYNYVAAYTPPYLGGMLMWHTGDIGWWFYSLDEVPYMVRGDEVNAYKVAKTMADSLAAFAATGNPSTETLQWTPYTADSHDTMVFDVNSQCRTGHDEELIRLMTQQ